ncbi:hypothetical protein AMAG_13521 [Allomyces macrogynus ATCC 38327]|uniref:DUF3719 domain-containing protein n=1 Tax=Allomyces macrogynus (strain ATCC 38327) TaxID=578462 RepID=A0A0L0T201_ALLM3|nr:hypothetical protein AMAG_13521 [Allomyces macrogynus ATCC 38327]|eukprot:KNE68883.1 hypothetical protein AMAG_13521 [Allomyces macrogynus ATCC 38327]
MPLARPRHPPTLLTLHGPHTRRPCPRSATPFPPIRPLPTASTFDYEIDRKEQLATALLHIEEWLNDEIAILDPQLIGGTDLVAEAARWKQRFPHFRARGTAIPRPNDPVAPDPLAVAIAAPDVDLAPTSNGTPSWAIPSSMLDWPAVAPALDWVLGPAQDAHDRWILLAQSNAVDDEARRIPLVELSRSTNLATLPLPDPPAHAFALLRTGSTTLHFAPHTSTVTAYDLVQLLSSSSLTCCDFSLHELEPTWDPTSSPLTDTVAVPILGPAAGTDTVDLEHGTPPPSAEELERYKHHVRHDSVASSIASADQLWSLSDELLSSLPDTWSSRGSWVHDDEDDNDLAAIRTAEDSDTGDDDDDDGWPRSGSLLTLNGTACTTTARPPAAPRFPPRPSAPPPPPLAARARLSSAHPRATPTGWPPAPTAAAPRTTPFGAIHARRATARHHVPPKHRTPTVLFFNPTGQRPARSTCLWSGRAAARQGAVRIARARRCTGIGMDDQHAADDRRRAFGPAHGDGWVEAGIHAARAIGAGAGVACAGDGVAARGVGTPGGGSDGGDAKAAGGHGAGISGSGAPCHD